jgi:hypothetical protein
LTIDDIINSRKINEVLLDKAEELFHLEFTLKQKAQLKYLQEKQKKAQHRFKMLNWLSHEFLWSPTPAYYLFTFGIFIYAKKRWMLKPYTIIPFMAIPATFDYISKYSEDSKTYQASPCLKAI